jgi:hypothetical protein
MNEVIKISSKSLEEEYLNCEILKMSIKGLF